MRIITRVGAITIIDLKVARFVRLGVAWKIEVCGVTLFMRRPR